MVVQLHRSIVGSVSRDEFKVVNSVVMSFQAREFVEEFFTFKNVSTKFGKFVQDKIEIGKVFSGNKLFVLTPVIDGLSLWCQILDDVFSRSSHVAWHGGSTF
jgi:hypothetical protein